MCGHIESHGGKEDFILLERQRNTNTNIDLMQATEKASKEVEELSMQLQREVPETLFAVENFTQKYLSWDKSTLTLEDFSLEGHMS